MLKTFLRDFRIWIILYAIFHLIFIVTPPLEPVHAWRQCLTNMIARNFVQDNATLLYPKIDIAGEHQGIIASELPLLQYIISIFYKVFGFSHWIGRLVNLLVSYLGIYLFYRAIELITGNKNLALFTGIFLLQSIWFSFARKSMPDTFSVSLAMISLFLLAKYIKQNNALNLVGFAILASVSILSKIPAALLLVTAPMLLLSSEMQLKQKKAIVVAGIFALILPLIWYGYWVPHLVEVYKFELFFPRTLKAGFNEIWQLRSNAADKLFNKGFYSYVMSMMAFGGIGLAIYKKSRKAMLLLLGVVPVFVYYALKTGLVFPTHSYYMIPLVPFMALSMAYLVQQISLRSNLIYILVFLGMVESIATQWNDFYVRDNKKYMVELEKECDNFSNRNAKVICNGTPNPQLMYFLNRRGWSLTAQELTNSETIETVRSFKPRWLIIDKHQQDALEIVPYWKDYGKVVYESENLLGIQLLY